MKKLIFIILLTTSCAVMPRVVPKQKGIAPIFEPYISDYRQIIGKDKYDYRFKRLSINFAELDGNVLGRCWWLLGGGVEIEIDKDWWYGFWTTQMDKKLVVYHELEHCIRYRLHTDRKEKIKNVLDIFDEIGYFLGLIDKPGFFSDGCAVSLMNSYTESTYCQEKHYSDYIKEMVDY